MGRLQKPTEVHRMNGNPSRKHLPEVSLAGSHLPIGNPPADLSAQEKVIWRRLVKELPFLNATNRAHLELAVHVTNRYFGYRKLFKERRAEAKAQGEPEEHGEMNDERTRPHPLLRVYNGLFDRYKSMLAELGANPSVQSRLLEYIDSSLRKRAKVERDSRKGYLT